MALPTYVSKTAFSSSLATLTIQPPGNVAQPTNRLLLVVLENANQNPPATFPQDGNGLSNRWNSINSNGTGTAGAIGGLGISVWWKWGSNNTALDDTFDSGDSGDHQTGSMITIDGADLTSPIHLSGTNLQTTATTAMSATGITTTVNDCLIVICTAFDLDSNTAGILSAPTNANLGSVTERDDGTSTVGTGGGVAIITGTKAVAGATGTTTATVTSTKMAHVTVAIKGATAAAAVPTSYGFIF